MENQLSGLLALWDNDSWGLQGCQGDKMNKECHLNENSGPHSTWDSPKQSWTSPECYSSFFWSLSKIPPWPKVELVEMKLHWRTCGCLNLLNRLLKHRVQLCNYCGDWEPIFLSPGQASEHPLSNQWSGWQDHHDANFNTAIPYL